MKKIIHLIETLLMALLLLSLVSCSKTAVGEDQSGNKIKGVNIDSLDWEFNSVIEDGERYACVSYTNNSNKIIMEFTIDFIEKSNITDEEKENYCRDIVKLFDGDEEDLEMVRAKTIEMNSSLTRVANPGDTVPNVYLYYYSSSFYVKEFSHTELVEPDIAKIKYVDDGKIITEYYDFKTRKYSFDEKTETACYWTESELGTVIPKPEVPVITLDWKDDEGRFNFKAYDFSYDDYKEYINKCKEMGFNIDITEHDNYFWADDNRGIYKIDVDYSGSERSISVEIEKQ